jgi:hypothetical protein
MNKIYDTLKLSALITITCIGLPVTFCSPQHAGGSEIGNPVVISGAVIDSLGKGMQDINLFLVDPTEINPLKLVPDSCYQAHSGSDGSYRFEEVSQGCYNLFGTDSSGEKMFVKPVTVTIEQAVTKGGFAIIDRPSDTIKDAARVVVAITPYPSVSGDFLFVPGTVIRSPVDSSEEYIVKCPPSVIDIVLLRNGSPFVLVNGLEVSQGQWYDLTGKKFNIPKPQIISGVITGVIGRMYFFCVNKISLGINNPVQYRFNWGDSLSPWSLSNQENHVWTVPGSLQVRVQARSIRDTLSVSEWSDAIEVQIQ